MIITYKRLKIIKLKKVIFFINMKFYLCFKKLQAKENINKCIKESLIVIIIKSSRVTFYIA